jgi:hypothetical protein
MCAYQWLTVMYRVSRRWGSKAVNKINNFCRDFSLFLLKNNQFLKTENVIWFRKWKNAKTVIFDFIQKWKNHFSLTMKNSIHDFITKYLIFVHMASTLEIVSLDILAKNGQRKWPEPMGTKDHVLGSNLPNWFQIISNRNVKNKF